MFIGTSRFVGSWYLATIALNLIGSNAYPTIPETSGEQNIGDGEAGCYDLHNVPHVSDIPNPQNCAKFFKCTLGIDFKPAPIPQDCGVGLHFDIESCNCEYPNVATCFDKENPDHATRMYECACPLMGISSGNNNTRNSDKCSIGGSAGLR